MINEMIKRCEFFSKRKIQVHIKTDKNFYNGFIEDIEKELIIFEDRVLGSIPLFFTEINKIN